ncbi:MAG: hypothetical protein WA840_17350, partial [Caulobacteraceae bacterium]
SSTRRDYSQSTPNYIPQASAEERANMELAPDVYFARVVDRGILLDVARDRYIGLGPSHVEAITPFESFGSIPEGDAFRAQREAAAKLARNGFLSLARKPRTTAVGAPATQSLWPAQTLSEAIRITPLQVVAIHVTLSQVALAPKVLPFKATVSWLKVEHKRKPRTGPTAPGDLVSAYFAARPSFPLQPICRLADLPTGRFSSQSHPLAQWL